MSRRSREDGSALPLVLGVVVLMVALVTVVTDASVLWLARRSLQATVDGAALAGAQAVDLPTVYAGGAHGPLRLDAVRARNRVRDYVRVTPSARQLSGFRVSGVRVTATTVTVRATATVRPPFTAWLTGRGVVVAADATAQNAAG